jgi:phosphoserine phosphatase RsbU/P
MLKRASQYVRRQLIRAGWPPRTRVGKVAFFILALDVAFLVLQKALVAFRLSTGSSLRGWVTFLAVVAVLLFAWLSFRLVRDRVLWRLRNRLLVTYGFVGVIPVILLVTLSMMAFYLFAGQFATFVATSGLHSELMSVQAANSAIAHELAARFDRGDTQESAVLEGLRQSDKAWQDREVWVWLDGRLVLNSKPSNVAGRTPTLPGYLKSSFEGVVRDGNKLYLRAAETVPVGSGKLTVISSEPLGEQIFGRLAPKLGEITLYANGLSLHEVDQSKEAQRGNGSSSGLTVTDNNGSYILDTSSKESLVPTVTAGSVPPPSRFLDRLVSFATAITVVNWETGDTKNPAAISVQTRLSMLYDRLFEALGEFAPAIEFLLLFMAIAFAIIELIAVLISVGLTRTITRSVAKLYDATRRINRGDFSHRIAVRSTDQLAALESSFNSMTASLEQLIAEQKEKQRLENELVIAQEVQAQLFPKEISQLESLEVHGFCRPARTVSGDYYDFLTLNSHKLTLAVGDISGKGISAALLMATIHSAVRAYSMESAPVLSLPVAVGASTGSDLVLASGMHSTDVSPAALLSLLNHQLYESTPQEKYATLFLGIYDGSTRTITYSNGGHLPPIILTADGSIRRLDCGGMVVGLFDNQTFEEATTQLKPGDIFLAYSDGVTEPENDFGEFGEERLIELVRANQHLPLHRITEVVTAAVDDWIGANEQPDDITLVLARPR